MLSVRKNHNLRLKTFDLMLKMKNDGISRHEIVDHLFCRFNIPKPALYSWYKGENIPWGRKGKIAYEPELFYVLGALLGDGCLYNWRITNQLVILVGDRAFTSKYAKRLSFCIGKKSTAYIDRSKNIYFVRTNNFELYSLFQSCRNINYLRNLIKQQNEFAHLLFLEGFFDAEGCVKVIRESSRKTPKICLDITNTNVGYLNLCKELFKSSLEIDAHYSTQKPKENRKAAHHLRIYKKQSIKRFFDNIKTTKLNEEKSMLLKSWLELGYSSSQPLTN